MNCLAESCNRIGVSKGYCGMHYHRLVRHGNASIVKNIRGKKTCSIKECTNKYRSLGYCDKHYLKFRKYGDPLVSKTKGRYLNKKGYVFVPDPTGKLHTIAEHRLVMEQHLARPLKKGENVHHINGNKEDNRIENLELWSISQPSGQRIEDKIKFAIEILEQYAPEKLQTNRLKGNQK